MTDIDATNHPFGYTPLMVALASKQWEVAKYLIEKGASLKRINVFPFRNPLIIACSEGLPWRGIGARPDAYSKVSPYDVIKIILEKGGGSDQNAIDAKIIKKLLIKYGANKPDWIIP